MDNIFVLAGTARWLGIEGALVVFIVNRSNDTFRVRILMPVRPVHVNINGVLMAIRVADLLVPFRKLESELHPMEMIGCDSWRMRHLST